jgi:hypothetical protein
MNPSIDIFILYMRASVDLDVYCFKIQTMSSANRSTKYDLGSQKHKKSKE